MRITKIEGPNDIYVIINTMELTHLINADIYEAYSDGLNDQDESLTAKEERRHTLPRNNSRRYRLSIL